MTLSAICYNLGSFAGHISNYVGPFRRDMVRIIGLAGKWAEYAETGDPKNSSLVKRASRVANTMAIGELLAYIATLGKDLSPDWDAEKREYNWSLSAETLLFDAGCFFEALPRAFSGVNWLLGKGWKIPGGKTVGIAEDVGGLAFATIYGIRAYRQFNKPEKSIEKDVSDLTKKLGKQSGDTVHILVDKDHKQKLTSARKLKAIAGLFFSGALIAGYGLSLLTTFKFIKPGIEPKLCSLARSAVILFADQLRKYNQQFEFK